MKHDKAILEFPENLYIERFDSKTVKLENGCILWTGYLSSGGYGIFYIPSELTNSNGERKYLSVLAHRVSWMRKRGRIPNGKQLDHLCRTRACINDEHLEPVTRKENILRGECPPAKNARKKCCRLGHPYSESNTYLTKTGYRICRKCRVIHVTIYRRNKSLAYLKTIPAAEEKA